jgi:hypothetical protein
MLQKKNSETLSGINRRKSWKRGESRSGKPVRNFWRKTDREHQKENSREEARLLELLKESLQMEPERILEQEREPDADVDWNTLLQLSGRHGISSLLYDGLVTKHRLPAQYRAAYEKKCCQTVLQSYRLLFLSRAVIEKLREKDIPALVLKGAGVAGLYPVPELRKSGDVDILLLKPEQIEQACDALKEAGFVQDEVQRSHHHIAMHSPERIEVEIHTMLADPFDDKHANRRMQESVNAASVHAKWENVMGISLPVLPDGEQAYALLLHMLQHYLRSGFGLKLLCDWTVFWNRPHDKDTEQRYLELIQESGLEGFSDMTTAVCVRYLGLRQEQVAFLAEGKARKVPTAQDAEAFLEEILDAGEFGKSQKDRMVSLRGTGIRAYAREFHHQMQLNYPKAGGVALLWPALWFMTLGRFLRNNRTIRHISAGTLLKKAGQRSRLTEKMALFRRA